MKKLVLLLSLLFVFNSCNLDDEPNVEYVLLPVESVEMPVDFNVNVINQIKIRYRRPTTCHLYDGIYYKYDGNTRIVAINAVKLKSNTCENAIEEGPYEVTLDFKPTESQTYLFKFWTGTNAAGEDEFLEYEAIVN